MDIVFFILIGLAGGVIAGMGMGGGTLLIPMLVIFMELDQHLSQGINLIAFIPMAIVALIIHSKNNLVDFKIGLPILLLGLVGAGIGAWITESVESDSLTLYFGIFLTILGVFQLINLFFKKDA